MEHFHINDASKKNVKCNEGRVEEKKTSEAASCWRSSMVLQSQKPQTVPDALESDAAMLAT